MQVRLTHDAPLDVRAGALVVPFFSDTSLDGVAKEIDAALGGVIADALGVGRNSRALRRTRAASTLKTQPYPSRARGIARGTRQVRALPPRPLRRNRGALSRPAQRRRDRDRLAAEAARGARAACRIVRRRRRDHRDRSTRRSIKRSPTRASRPTTIDVVAVGLRRCRARARHRARHDPSAKPSTSRDGWRSRPPTT